MTNKETELIALSSKLFDLYELKRNIGLLKSKQSYEERKKAFIDNALQELRRLQS